MSFQDKLRELIPEERRAAADEIFKGISDTFARYDEDIRALKEKTRARDGIDPKEFERLEREHGEYQKELATLRSELKKTGDSSKTLTERLTGVTGKLHATLVDVELRKAMGGYKFDPEAQNDVFALLKSQISMKVVEEGDAAKVVAKVLKDGQEADISVGDAVKTWVETSPLAKRVVIAAKTSGSGGGGGNSGGGAGKKWGEMSLKEQSEFWRKDPVAAKTLRDATA